MSYKDQRELDALPAEIESLETRHAELLDIIAQPGFYEQSPDEGRAYLDRLERGQDKRELDHRMGRYGLNLSLIHI